MPPVNQQSRSNGKGAHLLQQPPLLYDVCNSLLLDAPCLLDVLEGVDLLCPLVFNDADLAPTSSQIQVPAGHASIEVPCQKRLCQRRAAGRNGRGRPHRRDQRGQSSSKARLPYLRESLRRQRRVEGNLLSQRTTRSKAVSGNKTSSLGAHTTAPRRPVTYHTTSCRLSCSSTYLWWPYSVVVITADSDYEVSADPGSIPGKALGRLGSCFYFCYYHRQSHK